MGLLDDPKLMDLHEQINRAIQWNSRPDWQKVCLILNGMAMPDMLDELWRIKGTGWLNSLAQFAPNATGVNINRLRAAIGATQDQPPGDFDALLRQLPEDQQFAIMSVRAVTQAPDPLSSLPRCGQNSIGRRARFRRRRPAAQRLLVLPTAETTTRLISPPTLRRL
jgi:hypothetical protein